MSKSTIECPACTRIVEYDDGDTVLCECGETIFVEESDE